MDSCDHCLKPELDEIHGPVEACKENGSFCSEPQAHHKFQGDSVLEQKLFHALANSY